jgi:acetylornithine deacetylase/succinyl-diaminopimelate desuccinylase family protein
MSKQREALKRVCAYLDQHTGEMVGFLCASIGFASVNDGTPGSGKERELQHWLADRLRAFGFDRVDLWAADASGARPNVVGVLEGSGGSRPLILQGHCDVVPVPDRERQLWEVDPWAGTVREGRVYGRGASDMKGGNTALIWAAKAIRDCGLRLQGDLIVESVAGEESAEGGTIGTAATVERGYRAPFAVVAEPTNCEIHIESPGLFLFELTVVGKAAHTASRNLVVFPQRYGIPNGEEVGVDAIGKMKLFLELFERMELQWNQRWRGELLNGGGYPLPVDSQGVGVFNINPSLIEGGTYLGAVPSYCKLTCNVWYPNWVSQEQVIAEIDRNVRALASTDDWMRAHPPELKAPAIQEWAAAKVPRDHEGVRVLSEAFRQATGRPAVVSGFKAVCDATFLCQRGVPAVVMGPGDLRMGVHGANEHVPIDQVLTCAKTYAAMALSWCGLAGQDRGNP